MLKKKAKNDILLAFMALILSATVIIIIKTGRIPGKSVAVSVNGVTIETFSLNDNVEYEIHSEESRYNLLIIDEGSARIASADCPDKTCVRHKPINESGEVIICLPHKVIVSIE